MTSVAAAATQLATIAGADSSEMRRRVGSILCALAEVPEAYLYRVRQENGSARRCAFVVSAPGGTSGVARFDGQSIGDASWSPAHAVRRHRTRFVTGQDLLGPEYRQAPVFRKYYGADNVEEFGRLLAYDGQSFCEYVGVSFSDGGKHAREALKRLNAIVPVLSAALAQIKRSDDAALDGHPTLLFKPNGHLISASAAARTWLTPDRRAHLSSLVLRFDAGGPATETWVDDARCTLLRLDGDAVHYAALVSPAPQMRLSPLSALTPRQQEIAEFLVCDATTPQVAASLGISPLTVKAHIKAIYERLDVASRVELSQLLSEGTTLRP